MHLNIAEIIFFILLACVLVPLMVWLPAKILKESLLSLIGRPLGPGWVRVEAEIRPVGTSQEIRERLSGAFPEMYEAVYETDGAEHTAPLFDYCGGRCRCRLYVKQENPETVWRSKSDSRLTALIGVLLILAFWAGLIWGCIAVARRIF